MSTLKDGSLRNDEMTSQAVAEWRLYQMKINFFRWYCAKEKVAEMPQFEVPSKSKSWSIFFPQQKIGNIDIFFITSNENKMEIGNTEWI